MAGGLPRYHRDLRYPTYRECVESLGIVSVRNPCGDAQEVRLSHSR